MKYLALIAVLLTSGCAHVVPAAQAQPVKAPPTRPGPEPRIMLSDDDDEGMEDGELFVCGMRDGNLWCVDYVVFMLRIQAMENDPATEF
jgi:hypothetical protein